MSKEDIPDQLPEDPPSDPDIPPFPTVEIPGAPGWVQELFNRLDERDEIRRRTYTDKLRGLSTLVRELIHVMRRLDANVEVTKNEGRGQLRRITDVGVEVDSLTRRLDELERKVDSFHGRPSNAPPAPSAA